MNTRTKQQEEQELINHQAQQQVQQEQEQHEHEQQHQQTTTTQNHDKKLVFDFSNTFLLLLLTSEQFSFRTNSELHPSQTHTNTHSQISHAQSTIPSWHRVGILYTKPFWHPFEAWVPLVHWLALGRTCIKEG